MLLQNRMDETTVKVHVNFTHVIWATVVASAVCGFVIRMSCQFSVVLSNGEATFLLNIGVSVT